MKRLTYLVSLLLVAVSIQAASDDTISMVTYFPTPYMAYRDLDVSKSGAVGLIDRCTINCGTLTADTVNVTGGKLTLGGPNPVNVTNQFAFGSVGAGSAGTLKFEDNLEITNINNTALENIKVTGKATLSGLQLGAYDFPQCDTNTHKISYKELTLDGQKGTFLVCGEGSSAYQTCKAKNYESASFQTYDGLSRTMNSGLYDMSGTCGINAVASIVQSKTGVTNRCFFIGEGANTLSQVESDYLNCQVEANERYNSSDDWQTFSCVFAQEIYSITDVNGDPYCTAGVMTCNVKEETWECLNSQTCGNSKGSCL